MSALGVSSKLNVGREFLNWLFELGRQRADLFLSGHFDKIGKGCRRRSSSAFSDRLHQTVTPLGRGAPTPA